MATSNDFIRNYREQLLKIQLELCELHNSCTKQQLDDRFLKNFGCINFKSDDFIHELDLAREYHRQLIEKYPNEHRLTLHQPYRCYTVTSCKCGFSEACDSSD